MAPLSVLTFADVVLHFQSSPDASLLIWGAPDRRSLDSLTYDFSRPTHGTLKQPRDWPSRPEYIKQLPRPVGAAAPGQQTMGVSQAEAIGLLSIYLDDTPEEEQKKSGTAPWVAFACCCAWDEDARASAESARQKVAKADGFRQYLSAAEINIEPNPEGGCCHTSWRMGNLGLYRAILPLSAKVAMHTSHRDMLKDSQAPFVFDELNFRALESPLTGRFGEAMIAILALMPVRVLMAHQMSRSYLASRTFQSAAAGTGTGRHPAPAPVYTYTEVLSAILYHRLAQEFEMKHENSPISAEILQAMGELSLHTGPNTQNEAAIASSVALVTALKRLRKEYFWSAFPWCCTQTSRNRSALGSTLDAYLAQAAPVAKSKILAAVNVALNDKKRPLATLSALTPTVAWPLHKRLTNKEEVEPCVTREQQQAYSVAQLQSWGAVSAKQQLWASRAQEALAAAQQQAADQRAYDAAYALQMAAWSAQMAMQSMMPEGRPDDGWHQAAAQAHRTEYSVQPGEIAVPGQ